MSDYDGEIRFKITQDDSNFNKGINEVNNALKEVAKQAENAKKSIDSFDKKAFEDNWEKNVKTKHPEWSSDTANNSNNVNAEMEQADELIRQQVRAQAEARRAKEKLQEASDAASKKFDWSKVQQGATEFENLTQKVAYYKIQLDELQNSKGLGFGDSEYDSKYIQLNNASKELNDYKRNLTSAGTEAKKTSTSTVSALKKIQSALNKLNAKVSAPFKNMVSNMKSVDKKSHESAGMIEKFGKRIWGLAKRVFVFSLITKAFRAMVDGIKTGMQEFAKHNETFNKIMSDWSTATNQLKGQVGVAFAQLLQNIMPAITAVVNAISMAISYISMFIALLSGSGTWKKATSQQVDYADSLDKTAGSADKASKSLAKFDELNNTTTSSSSGGSGASGGNISYEDVPFDEDFLDAAEKVKKTFAKLFEPIKESWDKYGKFVMDSWKYALDEVEGLVKDIGRDFLEVWSEEKTSEIFDNILRILADIGLTIGNLAKNIREAWNYNKTGKKILEDIRDIIGIIVEHIREASDATVIWSENLNFIPLMTAIEEFLKAINPMIDNLSGIMLDFYTQVLLPLAKWTLEKGLPDLLDVLTAFVDSIDWEGLRSDFSEFWKVLEPFAETVGEGLILFLEDILKVASEIINSGIIQDCLKALEDWMKDVTAEDVKNGLETLIECILKFKEGMFLLQSIISLTTLSSILGFFQTFATSGATIAGGLDAVAGSASGLDTATGIASTALSGLFGLLLGSAAFDIFDGQLIDLMTDEKNNADAVDNMKDKYNGLSGQIKLVKDALSVLYQFATEGIGRMPVYIEGVTSKAEILSKAMYEAGNGTKYSKDELETMRDTMGLTNDDLDSIVNSMLDYNDKVDLMALGLGGWNGSFSDMTQSIAYANGTLEDFSLKAEDASNKTAKLSFTCTEADGTVTKVAGDVDNLGTKSASTAAKEKLLADGAEAWKKQTDDAGYSTTYASDKVKEMGDVASSTASKVSDSASSVSSSADTLASSVADSATKTSDSGTQGGSDYATNMATAISDGTEEVTTAVTGLSETASQSMEENESAYNSGVSYVKAMCEGITASTKLVTTALSEMISTMQTLFTKSFTVKTWTPLFSNMILAFQEQWELFKLAWTTNLALWEANNILNYFGVPVWTLFFDNILIAYRPKWTEFSKEWKTNMDNWKLTMIDPFFTIELWTQYGNNMKTGIEGGFNGIVDSIGNVLNAIADMFNELMSNIKSSMNSMADSFNKNASALGVNTIGHFSFSHVSGVSIPRLATGTVIPPGMSEFLAVLGDNNHDTEVVSPLTTMKQAMMEAINEMGGVGGSDGDIIVQCILDGKVVFEEVRKRNREYRKQTGSNAFA